jgi:hypothetical protein
MVETGSIRLEKTDIDRYRGSVAKKKGDFLLDFVLVLSN